MQTHRMATEAWEWVRTPEKLLSVETIPCDRAHCSSVSNQELMLPLMQFHNL